MDKNEKSPSSSTTPTTIRIEWTDFNDGGFAAVSRFVVLSVDRLTLPSLLSLEISVAAELRRRREASQTGEHFPDDFATPNPDVDRVP